MNLDESQRNKVATWIAEGQKLSEIQNRLASELDVHLTYMETRLLVDDLKLTPKDVEPSKPVPTLGAPAPAPAGAATPAEADVLPPEPQPEPEAAPAGTGKVSVSVDQITRPGAVISGKVTFSDGVKAEWYLDQMGRLGLGPEKRGYRPSATDVQQFQEALQAELGKLGM